MGAERWPYGSDERPDQERRLRADLMARSAASVVRPSANVAVVTLRALDGDREPPRALWVDVVLAANDAGARALVLERGDDGRDRLAAVDLEPGARGRLSDDAWAVAAARALVLGSGGG